MSSHVDAFEIEQAEPGTRLDTFLRTRYPSASRATLQRLIHEGAVQVDGLPVKASHQPRAGQRIVVRWPPPRPAVAQPEPIPLVVLFEDDDLIVLNKPAGLVVHPAAGNEEHTLVNALLHHCGGRLSGIGGVVRPGIVHRLDKETSGCLVVAKNDAAHLGLARQFADRQIGKCYDALVCGELHQAAGEIRAPIMRHPSHRKCMTVSQDQGREAWTSYRIRERLREATFVEVQLHTGRTHQIRVHFQHLGFPLVGDRVYGKRQNQRLEARTGYVAPRQMLHARELGFTHPRTAVALCFEAPWPEDFQTALATLRIPAAS